MRAGPERSCNMSDNHEPDGLLKITEVGKLLASSTRHVWRLIAKGELPQPVHVGRSARLFRADVEAYLKTLRRLRDEGGATNQSGV